MPTPAFDFVQPTYDELVTERAWLADPEFMSYNVGFDPWPGYDPATGCIVLPDDYWRDFHRQYSAGALRRFWYVVADGEPIGHAHYRCEDDGAHIGFNIVPSRRSEGFGTAVLAELVRRIWADTDVEQIVNDFEPTRMGAVIAHDRVGFERVDELRVVLRRPS